MQEVKGLQRIAVALLGEIDQAMQIVDACDGARAHLGSLPDCA
jgi:hypothetical protein